jgi:hypothetical protein
MRDYKWNPITDLPDDPKVLTNGWGVGVPGARLAKAEATADFNPAHAHARFEPQWST